MELLMPDILAFSSRTFHVYESQEYENAVKWSKKPKSTARQWKVSSALLHDILKSSNNLLFSNLYAALELHAEIPFLVDYQQPITSYVPHFDTNTVGWLLDFLGSSNRFMIHQRFTEHYHTAYLAIEKSFENLSLLFPETEENTAPFFFWSVDKGRPPYYLQVARDLIEKINVGVYPNGKYLPSLAALARQYQTSLDTIRKAIRYLNNIGIAHTHNGKGTHAVRTDRYAYQQYGGKTETLLYLSGIQLMALLIRPAALLVFDLLDSEIQKRLEQLFFQPNVIPLAKMVDCIIQNMPLYPFKVILREISNLLNWGFYFYYYGQKSANRLTHISLKAFSHLQKGDRRGFADLLFECYCHILKNMRTILVDGGLAEAEGLLALE